MKLDGFHVCVGITWTSNAEHPRHRLFAGHIARATHVRDDAIVTQLEQMRQNNNLNLTARQESKDWKTHGRSTPGPALDVADRLPRAVQALIEVSRIRILAEAVGVRRVENENERLICRLARTGKQEAFLKAGTRFPRLSATDPYKKLLEIQTFLTRNQ